MEDYSSACVTYFITSGNFKNSARKAKNTKEKEEKQKHQEKASSRVYIPPLLTFPGCKDKKNLCKKQNNKRKKKYKSPKLLLVSMSQLIKKTCIQRLFAIAPLPYNTRGNPFFLLSPSLLVWLQSHCCPAISLLENHCTWGPNRAVRDAHVDFGGHSPAQMQACTGPKPPAERISTL